MATTITSSTSTSDLTSLQSTMNAKSTVAADSVQADTDKFMTLLVAQLRNQDPLNPMDNAEMTSQLAQLSTVTGINKLNSTLETLQASYQASESMQAANLIGHGVLVEGNNVVVSKGQAILGFELGSSADSVQLIVTDPKTGKDVATIDLGAQQAGIVPVAWDGVPDPNVFDDEGNPVPLADGQYTFRVVAMRSGAELTDVVALGFDSVASVTTNTKDGVKLNLPITGSVTMADIKQIL